MDFHENQRMVVLIRTEKCTWSNPMCT